MSYTGKSKTQLSAETYELKNQYPFDDNSGGINITAPVSVVTHNLGTAGAKESYITAISLSLNIVSLTQVTFQRVNGQIFYRYLAPVGVSTTTLYFNPPISVPSNQITITFGGPLAINDDYLYNIYGWNE